MKSVVICFIRPRKRLLSLLIRSAIPSDSSCSIDLEASATVSSSSTTISASISPVSSVSPKSSSILAFFELGSPTFGAASLPRSTAVTSWVQLIFFFYQIETINSILNANFGAWKSMCEQGTFGKASAFAYSQIGSAFKINYSRPIFKLMISSFIVSGSRLLKGAKWSNDSALWQFVATSYGLSRTPELISSDHF